MIHKYMYDGLLSSIAIELLEKYPHQETVAGVLSVILSGASTDERYAKLATKWAALGCLTLSGSDIGLLLQNYPQSRRALISPLVRTYLDSPHPSPDSALLSLLNTDPDESWLVPMLSCGMLADPPGRLVGLVQKMVKEVIFLHEFENKLVFPYYVAIYQT
jgi:hypothetical protein